MYPKVLITTISKTINNIHELLKDLSKPSVAFLDNLMITVSKGTNIGKLNTAINPKPEFVFEAIAETKLSNVENAMQPKIKLSIK